MERGVDPAVWRDVERAVSTRAMRRVRDLRVEVVDGRVVLRGRADTYYAKQLAQAGAREVLPGASLVNAITVG
jgi:osmotically-inducible protein OsmY